MVKKKTVHLEVSGDFGRQAACGADAKLRSKIISEANCLGCERTAAYHAIRRDEGTREVFRQKPVAFAVVGEFLRRIEMHRQKGHGLAVEYREAREALGLTGGEYPIAAIYREMAAEREEAKG